MNNVKNNDKPTSTWLGGAVCVPSADLTKCNTINILVNEVIIITRIGATATSVSIMSILSVPERLPCSSVYVIDKLFDTFKSRKSSGVSALPGSLITVGCSVQYWLAITS